MKIEVFNNGKLLYSISGTDDFDPSDIVVVSKKMIEGATMSAQSFDELFFTKMRESRTQIEAYEKAESQHFSTFGHHKYSDYDSFKVSKSNRLKK